jgi:hypothetical protein
MTLVPGVEVVWRIPVDIRFAHFLVIESFSGRLSSPDAWSHGLVAVYGTGSESIRCRTGHKTPRVLVSVETSAAAPESDFSFDDVVEVSFRSASGQLSIADWQKRLVRPLSLLPWEGWSRLRYHTRRMEDGGVGECLIQIWPAEPTSSSSVRITSKLGRFWHPGPQAGNR